MPQQCLEFCSELLQGFLHVLAAGQVLQLQNYVNENLTVYLTHLPHS